MGGSCSRRALALFIHWAYWMLNSLGQETKKDFQRSGQQREAILRILETSPHIG